MNPSSDTDPNPLDELARDLAETENDDLDPVAPQPVLDDLTPESSGRIVRYIVTSTLEHGVAPTAVVALYADLAGDETAVRYADRRFILREMPSDWRDVESRVMDLEQGARERGLDLAAAWRRATGVAMAGQDALEQLARLAGVTTASVNRQRSIFDDPDDLDSLDQEPSADEFFDRLTDREPELVDLAPDAQRRIRRFAIEERLERGLPPVELIDLYRALELAGDARAQQYLDLVYVEHTPQADWLELQSEAGRLVDMAEARGKDGGRLFADLLRSSPGIEPVAALRLLMERLAFQKF
jgi:hypothetical protein